MDTGAHPEDVIRFSECPVPGTYPPNIRKVTKTYRRVLYNLPSPLRPSFIHHRMCGIQ